MPLGSASLGCTHMNTLISLLQDNFFHVVQTLLNPCTGQRWQSLSFLAQIYNNNTRLQSAHCACNSYHLIAMPLL